MGLEYIVDMKKKMPIVGKTIISQVTFLNTYFDMEVVHCKNCTDWDQMCRTVAQSINY